jgi:cell wall-associated protease
VVASGEDFADALSAAFLAGQNKGELVLTQTAQLPQTTSDYLSSMGYASNARPYVVDGGSQITDAVTAAVETAFNKNRSGSSTFPKVTVQRVRGGDRYGLGPALLALPGMTVGSTQSTGRTAIVASGVKFADALTMASLSYSQHFPLLLTDPNALPSSVDQALRSAQIQTVLLAGGTAAVSGAVESQIRATGANVVRFAGADRQDTAIKVADYAVANLGYKNTDVSLARGDDFPDALAGSQYSSYRLAPILLTETPDSLGARTDGWLRSHCNTLSQVWVFGGVAAISDRTGSQASSAVGSC